jgi:hypothetical protein
MITLDVDVFVGVCVSVVNGGAVDLPAFATRDARLLSIEVCSAALPQPARVAITTK